MKGLLYKLGTQTAVTVTMLLLVFAPFQALVAQAQTEPAPGSPVFQAAQAQVPAAQAAADKALQQTPNDILASCKQLLIGQCVGSLVYVFTIGIGSAFAYVAAYFFDITIQLSLNGASYGLDFVSTSWTTARDLGNMAFLFILIYIAFTIILRADTSGTMSLLAGVIIVALLVNFSFFFSRVIIDAGNILAIQFYNAIPAPPVSQTIQGVPVAGQIAGAITSTTNYLGAPGNAKDLTASIMNMIQVQNLLNNGSFAASNGSLVATIFIYLTAAIVLWLLTVAFITNGVKFLFRVVVLWFLIIVSPFAFVAAAVQGLNTGYFKQWREMLITHAFYPVAFMFIFLILNNFAITVSGGNTSLVTGVFNTLQSGTTANTWGAIGAALVSVAIRLGLVIAVLFVGMRASDKISVAGSKYAEKAGSWFGTGMLKSYNVAYKRAGPGAAVGALDRSLEKGMLARVGNSTLGYEFRRYVSKPLANTRIPGSHGESNPEMKARQKKEGEEKKANVGARDSYLRSQQNTKDLEWMTKQSADYQAAKTKAFALRTPKEQELVDEGDRIKTRMKGFGENDFASIKFADIKAMANVITENQLKMLNSGKKLSDEEKEELTTEWNTKNSGSAYQKAHKEVDELRAIASELHGAGITLAQIDAHIGGAATAARSDALVTKDIIKDIHKEAKRKMASLDNEIATDTRAGLDTTDKRENKDKLKEAMEHMTKLAAATGDVQANIGGEKEEGKFRTK